MTSATIPSTITLSLSQEDIDEALKGLALSIAVYDRLSAQGTTGYSALKSAQADIGRMLPGPLDLAFASVFQLEKALVIGFNGDDAVGTMLSVMEGAKVSPLHGRVVDALSAFLETHGKDAAQELLDEQLGE